MQKKKKDYYDYVESTFVPSVCNKPFSSVSNADDETANAFPKSFCEASPSS